MVFIEQIFKITMFFGLKKYTAVLIVSDSTVNFLAFNYAQACEKAARTAQRQNDRVASVYPKD